MKTLLGNVEIENAEIVRSSGYGQYTINVGICFEGERKTLSAHSTDSQLFDNATDEDIAVNGQYAYLLENANYTIESMVEDYINSL
jgi:hypothetical protein